MVTPRPLATISIAAVLPLRAVISTTLAALCSASSITSRVGLFDVDHHPMRDRGGAGGDRGGQQYGTGQKRATERWHAPS